jgi:hypothetical protein
LPCTGLDYSCEECLAATVTLRATCFVHCPVIKNNLLITIFDYKQQKKILANLSRKGFLGGLKRVHEYSRRRKMRLGKGRDPIGRIT